MTSAVLATPPYLAFYDLNGDPLADGLVYTYAAGTDTPKATYTNQAGNIAMSNPIELDSAGRSTWWLNGSYKYVVKDALGNTIATTDNVTGFSTGTDISNGSITYPQLSGSVPIGGFVNKFRNPGMVVWQRGTSVTVTAGTSAYTADGWIVGATGANALVTQGGQIAYSLNSMQITGNSSMSNTYVKQRIESSISAPLAGQQVTIRLQCWNAGTGVSLTPTLTVKTPTATDNYASTNSVVTASSFQAIPYLSSSVISYTFACPATAANGLEVMVDFGSVLDSNAKYLYVTDFDIRLTPGFSTGLNSNAAIPELRPLPVELIYCQRYLPTFGGTTGPIGSGASTSTSASGYFLPFRTTVRGAPTALTITTPANMQIANFAGTDVAALTGMTFSKAGPDGAFVTVAVAATPLTANLPYLLYAKTALAGNLIFTGSEI